MISVVIPLMPVSNYEVLLNDCLESLNKQTVNFKTLVVKQPVERYIEKNRLLNVGFKNSTTDRVFFCDADFVFEDRDFLKKMNEKLDEGYDVVWPQFYSDVYEDYRIADGAPCFNREVMLKHGPLNESLRGISWVTFPFLAWCLDNTKYYCGEDIVLTHQRGKTKGKRNGSSASKVRPLFKQTVKRLKREGLWPA